MSYERNGGKLHGNISRNGYGNAMIGRYGGCFEEGIWWVYGTGESCAVQERLAMVCRGKLSTTSTYGTGAPCSCGKGAEGAQRADRGEHTGSLPRFGPRWTRKTLLLLDCIELGSSGA